MEDFFWMKANNLSYAQKILSVRDLERELTTVIVDTAAQSQVRYFYWLFSLPGPNDLTSPL